MEFYIIFSVAQCIIWTAFVGESVLKRPCSNIWLRCLILSIKSVHLLFQRLRTFNSFDARHPTYLAVSVVSAIQHNRRSIPWECHGPRWHRLKPALFISQSYKQLRPVWQVKPIWRLGWELMALYHFRPRCLQYGFSAWQFCRKPILKASKQ